jgi:hypothetical protein
MSDDRSQLKLSLDQRSVEPGIADRRIAPVRQERPDWAKCLDIGEDEDLSLDEDALRKLAHVEFQRH